MDSLPDRPTERDPIEFATLCFILGFIGGLGLCVAALTTSMEPGETPRKAH